MKCSVPGLMHSFTIRSSKPVITTSVITPRSMNDANTTTTQTLFQAAEKLFKVTLFNLTIAAEAITL